MPILDTEKSFMAGTVDPLSLSLKVHRTAQMRATLAEGNETLVADPDQEAGVIRCGIVKDTTVANSERTCAAHSNFWVAQLSRLLPDTQSGDSRIGNKRGARHENQRLREFTPGDKVIVGPLNREVSFPGR